MEPKPTSSLLWRWLASAASIYIADWLLDGITVTDFWGALWVALLLGVFNILLKPILMLISLPFIVFTFGLFLLIINAVILLFVSDISASIEVNGFWTAVLGSVIISLVTYLLNPPRRNNNDGNGNGRGGIYIKVGDKEFRG